MDFQNTDRQALNVHTVSSLRLNTSAVVVFDNAILSLNNSTVTTNSIGTVSDGRIDGRDFLAWQRGVSPTPYSSGDLADWQNAYNGGALSAATAVPEPSSLILFILFLVARSRTANRHG